MILEIEKLIKGHFPVEKKKDILEMVIIIAKDFINMAFKSGVWASSILLTAKAETLIKKLKNWLYLLGSAIVYL